MATNLDLAGKVARNVELDSVNLRHAKVNTSCEPADMPEEVTVDIQYRTSMSRRQQKGDTSVSELVLAVEFKFQARGESEGTTVDVITAEACYQLMYTLNASVELDESCFKHFAEVNGPYNAWPYWREFVQSVTGRVGLPGFVVPVFRPAAVEVADPSAAAKGEANI